ncbi:MAG: V-type ATP synthase subunit I [Candidatus Poribacteria bacterium]
MAVSQMQRVRIFAHSSHRASLIKDLQELEIVHINNINEDVESSSEGESKTKIRNLQNDLSRLQSTIQYVYNYEPKKGLLNSFMGGGKPIFSFSEFDEIGKKIEADEWQVSSRRATEEQNVCDECNLMGDHLTRLTNQESRLHSEKENLIHWLNLDSPIENLHDTEKTAIRVGTIPIGIYDSLINEIRSSNIDLSVEVIDRTIGEVNVVMIFLKSEEQIIAPILAKNGFSMVSLPISSGKVIDRLKQIDDGIADISVQRNRIKQRSSELAFHRPRLMATYDYMREMLDREEVKASFTHTEYTFMIDGWSRKSDVPKMKEILSKKYEEIEIEASDPTDEDEPPVELKNNPVVRPYRMVTSLYGIPHYREIDPTKLLAPFLTIGFAICLTDAGYGFTVALLAGIIMILNRKRGVSDLIRILFLCGLTTGLIGAITGGWYGFTAKDLEESGSFLRHFVLLDPNVKQLEFLALIVLFGYIEVCFGFMVKTYISLKSRDWMSAFCDQIPWVLIMLLAAVFVLGMIGVEVPSMAKKIALAVIILCALIIVAFAGRDVKNIAGRIGSGIFAIYGNVTGTFGDTLSYMRLFALGLATGIIASSVNTIAGMLWTSTPGKIGAILVLIFGHPFNIAINALGGFIHSMRLQFVEFFTKFYEGGGTEFNPFKKKHIYIGISDEIKN